MTAAPIQCVGIDVSSVEFHVAIEGHDDVAVFRNDDGGFKALIKKLTKRGRSARVVLEATGSYHLELACALADAEGVEVMVANPRSTKHFHMAQGLRAKTDRVDARSLMSFAQVMPFVPWTKPTASVLRLRACTRYMDQLVKDRTRLVNQRHSMRRARGTPELLLEQLDERIDAIDAMLRDAEALALSVARAEPLLNEDVDLLSTIPGIGKGTAVRMVAELASLPEDMTTKQLTAWAGLDPRPRESGSSLRGRRRISKRGSSRVRRILYMPAVTAQQHNPPLRALYQRVSVRSGAKMVGIVAVMRKLLVLSWTLLKNRQPWRPNAGASEAEGLTASA